MFSLRGKKLELPTAAEALAGRAQAMSVPARHFVNGHRLQPPFPQGLQIADFGLGCFWGAERKFWTQPGVYSTAVGYAGGVTPNPTYEEVCTGMTGHTEVVRVDIRSRTGQLRRTAAGVLGIARPDARHAAGQRHRHPIPFVDLYGTMPSSARRQNAALQAYGSTAGGRHGPSRPRSGKPRFLLRRGLPPAIPRQEPRRLLRTGWHRRVMPGRRRRGFDGLIFLPQSAARLSSAGARPDSRLPSDRSALRRPAMAAAGNPGRA